MENYFLNLSKDKLLENIYSNDETPLYYNEQFLQKLSKTHKLPIVDNLFILGMYLSYTPKELLEYSIRNNDNEILLIYIKKSKNDGDIFSLACVENNLNAVEKLFYFGCKINKNVLEITCQTGNDNILYFLLENKIGKLDFVLFNMGCKFVKVIQLLLNYDCPIVPLKGIGSKEFDYVWNTGSNHTKKLLMLYNYPGSLKYACKIGDLQALKILLKDYQQNEMDKKYICIIAIKYNNNYMLRYIFQNRLQVRNSYLDDRAIKTCILYDNYEGLQILLKNAYVPFKRDILKMMNEYILAQKINKISY